MDNIRRFLVQFLIDIQFYFSSHVSTALHLFLSYSIFGYHLFSFYNFLTHARMQLSIHYTVLLVFGIWLQAHTLFLFIFCIHPYLFIFLTYHYFCLAGLYFEFTLFILFVLTSVFFHIIYFIRVFRYLFYSFLVFRYLFIYLVFSTTFSLHRENILLNFNKLYEVLNLRILTFGLNTVISV